MRRGECEGRRAGGWRGKWPMRPYPLPPLPPGIVPYSSAFDVCPMPDPLARPFAPTGKLWRRHDVAYPIMFLLKCSILCHTNLFLILRRRCRSSPATSKRTSRTFLVVMAMLWHSEWLEWWVGASDVLFLLAYFKIGVEEIAFVDTLPRLRHVSNVSEGDGAEPTLIKLTMLWAAIYTMYCVILDILLSYYNLELIKTVSYTVHTVQF
jgi:hypothetical protein